MELTNEEWRELRDACKAAVIGDYDSQIEPYRKAIRENAKGIISPRRLVIELMKTPLPVDRKFLVIAAGYDVHEELKAQSNG